MEFAYRPEAWETMFEMVALASVTLTGLLFVGLSINLRSIVATPAHFARAREALIAQLVLLIIAIFVLIPGQGRVALGIELVAVSLVVLAVSLRLQSSTLHHLPAPRRHAWGLRLIALNGATVAIAIAGVGLVMRRLGGFLWLVPTILTCLLWSTYNAWSLLTRGMEIDA
jgi:hypothetical protein